MEMKERYMIIAVQIEDNLRFLLGIRRMDKVPNARIRQLSGVTKGLSKMIGECVLRWFRDVERMENDRIAKRVYVGECDGSRSVGSPRERRNDTVNDCVMKTGLDMRQARRMMHDRSVWRDFVRGNATVVSCNSYMKPLKGGSPFGANLTT